MTRIVVKFFASLREAFGEDQIEVEIDPSWQVQQLVDQLKAQYPNQLLSLDSPLLAARDQSMISLEDTIGDAQEIALFPPVTGG
jgi:molybdopterin synthase sulfur carrier subunit